MDGGGSRNSEEYLEEVHFTIAKIDSSTAEFETFDRDK
jgi:hypothetical protein